MINIVSSSEIHLHLYLWISGLENWKKQPLEMFSKKCVFENFAKLTEKHLCPSPTRIFYRQFYEILENTFLQDTSGQLLLIMKLDGQKF